MKVTIFSVTLQEIRDFSPVVAPQRQPQTIVHEVYAQHGLKSSRGEEFEYPSRSVMQTGHADVRGTASAPFWLAGHHGTRCSIFCFPTLGTQFVELSLDLRKSEAY